MEVKQIFEECDQKYACDDVKSIDECSGGGNVAYEGHNFQSREENRSVCKDWQTPKSTKWVDTDKSHGEGEMLVRSRWVARSFRALVKTIEKTCLRHSAARVYQIPTFEDCDNNKVGRKREMLFIDLKKVYPFSFIPKKNLGA